MSGICKKCLLLEAGERAALKNKECPNADNKLW